MITPTILVNMMLANGIVYDNEDFQIEDISDIVLKATERVENLL